MNLSNNVNSPKNIMGYFGCAVVILLLFLVVAFMWSLIVPAKSSHIVQATVTNLRDRDWVSYITVGKTLVPVYHHDCDISFDDGYEVTESSTYCDNTGIHEGEIHSLRVDTRTYLLWDYQDVVIVQ